MKQKSAQEFIDDYHGPIATVERLQSELNGLLAEGHNDLVVVFSWKAPPTKRLRVYPMATIREANRDET